MTTVFIDRYAQARDVAGVVAEIACGDCPSEVRNSGWRFRVIHQDDCPSWQRYQKKLPGYTAMPSGVQVMAGEDPPEGTTMLLSNSGGGVPCGVTVAHRGPYRRTA